MTVDEWWPRLTEQTRRLLVDTNGEAVPLAVRAEIARAGGPGPDEGWWATGEAIHDRFLPDEAVDRVEELANREADV